VDSWVCIEAGRRRRTSLAHRVRHELPLLRLWTVRVFRTRYRQSALDVLWSVLSPIAVLLIYGFILTAAFDVTGDGVPYWSFAWAGLVVWTFLSTTVQTAAPSITAVGDTISKIYFPREVIPLAEVGAGLIDLAIGLVLLVVLAAIQGIVPTETAIATVPVVLVLTLWTASLSILAATVSVFIRDLRPAIGLILRVGFIATPIMYPVSSLPESLQWTADVNPAAVLAEALRDCLLRGTWPDWTVLLLQGVVAGALLVAGVLYTRAIEHRMVDVV
jgi:ABC-type polysaccharide/polyol phosphate export permease